MTDHYKLTYFNARGSAEPIRYIFALSGIEYEDIRLDKAEWPAVKPTTRWGQVPFIEVNGEPVAQSLAISRYLARKYKLAGETPMEEFRADELVDQALTDLRPHMGPIFKEQDERKKMELKKEFITTHAKPFLEKLTVIKENNGGKWLIGSNVTWADAYLSYAIDYVKICDAEILSEFPVIKEFYDNFVGLPQIKKWIEIRPKTDM